MDGLNNPQMKVYGIGSSKTGNFKRTSHSLAVVENPLQGVFGDGTIHENGDFFGKFPGQTKPLDPVG
jgi:hypothetical protein